MKIDKLKELLRTDIDAFEKEAGRVFREGDFGEVVRVVGVGREDALIELHAGADAVSVEDAVLGTVVRDVWHETGGERDIADLLGASKGALCRLCKHAVFGCCCGSEERRKAELEAGGVPEFCELFGREQLFFGAPCEFFEFGYEGMEDAAGDDVEAEVAHAAHCNQYEHAPDCENTGKANGVKKKLSEVKQALEKLGQGNENLRKGLELTAKLLDGYMRDFEQAASEAERTAILAEAQDMVDYAQDLLGDVEKLGNMEQEPKAKRYFPEAKDIEEATRNTQALAEGAAVNWGEGVPVHIVNQYNEVMGEMMEKYPLRAKFVRLGAYVGNNDATLARCRAGAMGGDDVLLLELNKNHDINGIHALSEGRLFSAEEQARTGYTRYNVGATEDGMNVRAVTIHEYGHGIKSWCNLRSIHSDMFDIDEVREARNALDEWTQAVKSARKSGFKVSQYGDADDEEFFAECFAARELGEKLPEGVERAMNKLVVLALKK